jgi:hypothetical protein
VNRLLLVWPRMPMRQLIVCLENQRPLCQGRCHRGRVRQHSGPRCLRSLMSVKQIATEKRESEREYLCETQRSLVAEK